ncbi:MAG: VOC family protein [Acidimicrobiales bacterium]
MTAPIKLAHVVFRTGQLAAMREWYCTVLEAHVVYENDHLAFATYDDEHHRLAFIDTQASERPGPQASGVDHVAFTYESMGDLLDTFERLKGIDISPYRTINHGPTTSMYFRDPDGNQVELQIDNFDTVEQTDAFIRSEVFAKNPIGVEFDPDVLVERFRRGDPHHELIEQGSA